jgi:DNA-binding transcriptional MerR regulator
MTTTDQSTYTLEELASLVEMPRRTVRYYIQEGLVDRPIGEKRGAHYTQVHMDQLLTIRKWQNAGVSLERIKEILSSKAIDNLPPPRPRGTGTVEVWSHLVVTDGIEVTLEPGRSGMSPDEVRRFFRGVTALYEQIKKEGNDDVGQ